MRYLAIAAAVLVILVGVIFSTTGKKMMQADSEVKVAFLPEPTSEGAMLYDRFCGQCHGRPETTTHTAENWPRVVERMKKNISSSGKQMPDERQTQIILNYLSRHAG